MKIFSLFVSQSFPLCAARLLVFRNGSVEMCNVNQDREGTD